MVIRCLRNPRGKGKSICVGRRETSRGKLDVHRLGTASGCGGGNSALQSRMFKPASVASCGAGARSGCRPAAPRRRRRVGPSSAEIKTASRSFMRQRVKIDRGGRRQDIEKSGRAHAAGAHRSRTRERQGGRHFVVRCAPRTLRSTLGEWRTGSAREDQRVRHDQSRERRSQVCAAGAPPIT